MCVSFVLQRNFLLLELHSEEMETDRLESTKSIFEILEIFVSLMANRLYQIDTRLFSIHRELLRAQLCSNTDLDILFALFQWRDSNKFPIMPITRADRLLSR